MTVFWDQKTGRSREVAVRGGWTVPRRGGVGGGGVGYSLLWAL